MDNYPFIIGGLPTLTADFEVQNFSYDKLREEICSFMSTKDVELVKFMEYGFDEDHLNDHFYALCERKSDRFVREYFAFDRKVRNEKVAFIESKPTEDDSDLKKTVLAVFAEKNIIERERKLDALYWSHIEEIVCYDILDKDVILAFLAKSHIVERWCRLDKAKGAEFLAKLVTEVRGTFHGVKYEE
jgi:hypothetical protein